jgi:hypothetical protein
MADLATHSKKMASLLVGATVVAFSLWQINRPAPASAAPAFVHGVGSDPSLVEPAQIFKRGRPPIYPYYYNPGRPGGWSFYFGPVPYAKGDFEVQALQRIYPQTNWPPGMRYWTPKSGFPPDYAH